jgi:hypothetical protein
MGSAQHRRAQLSSSSLRASCAVLFAIGGAALAIACTSSSISSTSPSFQKCAVTLGAPNGSVAAGGGSATLTINTAPECTWTVSNGAGWLSITPMSGQGSGQVTVQVAPNQDPATRQSDVMINGQRATLRQDAAACQFGVSPQSIATNASGGSAIVSVTTGSACNWTVVSNAPWIAVSASSGGGAGQVTLTFQANTGAARTGTVTIGGQTVTITQSAVGMINCSYTIAPGSPQTVAATAGTIAVTVTTSGGCAWAATSGVPWITVASGAAGSGNGTASLTVAANTGGARTGTVTIAGQTLTVNQGAASGISLCTFSISVATQSFDASGGNGTAVTVSAGSGCAWTAVSNVPWITVTSGASGTGGGTVKFTVAANSGAARSGTLTIAGQPLTVNQAGAPCPSSINPTSQSIAAAGGSGTAINVSADNSCSWTAVSNASWLTINGNPTHSGNGSISFTVAANIGPQRTGTISIGGQTFTVTQANGCTFAVSPLSETVGSDKGPGQPISVTTVVGCSWTATTSTSWISITSGASGTGSGTVQFSVDKFNGNQRNGSLTVGGQTVSVTQR